MHKIVDGIARTHQEVRRIAKGLIPLSLDSANGLMDALRELATRTDRLKDVTCAFKCDRPVEITDASVATHLYRIAQEAVTNALKHGQPHHILISLESKHGGPTLLVADDGTGFDPTQETEGMGLKTMRYRASLMGANLTVTPVKTGGTVVTCAILGGATVEECRMKNVE
jgi:signal transduction histidine kinase